MRLGGRFFRAARKSRGKAFEICLHRDGAVADGGLETFPAKGKGAARRQGAEQDRADHAAGLAGGKLHIESDEFARPRHGRVQDIVAVAQTVAHRRFLGDGVNPVCRCNQSGAVPVHETAQNGAPGLHEFSRDDNVDITRHR